MLIYFHECPFCSTEHRNTIDIGKFLIFNLSERAQRISALFLSVYGFLSGIILIIHKKVTHNVLVLHSLLCDIKLKGHVFPVKD